MYELPFAVGAKDGLNIVVRVADRVPRTAVADFKEKDFGVRAVHEMMPMARPCFEPGAHAGLERQVASVGDQGRLACEHVDELVLTRMGMA